jgi:hypothetical protein
MGIYTTVVPRLVRGIQAWLLQLDTAHKARYDGFVDTYGASASIQQELRIA